MNKISWKRGFLLTALALGGWAACYSVDNEGESKQPFSRQEAELASGENDLSDGPSTFSDNVEGGQSAQMTPSMISQEFLAKETFFMADPNVQVCDGFCYPGDGNLVAPSGGEEFEYSGVQQPGKMMRGVGPDDFHRGREARWRNGGFTPWEEFAYGEYLGPYRTPHVSEYRLRVADQVEFVFGLSRRASSEDYQLNVGDKISLTSAIAPEINQADLRIQPDGKISLPLIGQVYAAGKTVKRLQTELQDRFSKFIRKADLVVQITDAETPLKDLLETVDTRFGSGGRSRTATVTPDGTIALPLIGNVPAVGLSLDEIRREVNVRYQHLVSGIEVTPVLLQRAPRFIYVVGEVRNSGRFELTGPTTAMQALALAGGFNYAGNIRQIIVFRRDQNWKLVATKLDLSAPLFGKTPQPSDEIWLRDSDIVLIPPKPIQRFSEAVNLYMTNTLYRIFPQQGVAFNFDGFTNL